MSQSWAGTSNGYARRLFLGHLRTIVERLEFADELGLQQHRQHLGGNAATAERLLLDLFAECSRRGRGGARFYAAAEKLWRQLEACAQAHDLGDIEPWRQARRGAVERLDALWLMCEPQQDVGGGVTPAAVDEVCPEAREARPYMLPHMSPRACRVLRLLLEHNATSEADRVTRFYVHEESGLSETQVRRIIENELNPHGLLGSKPGREGGVWLLAQQIEVVRQALAGK